MNIYEKLAAARVELQQADIKKSGHNNFSGYDYFELRDFLPEINALMAKYKLLGVCSFTAEEATLTIYDAEEPETLVFRSPHAAAELKGCHPIQNQGAVETYQRRYLWMAAFEIVDSDALDATQERPEKKKAPQKGQASGGSTCEVCGASMTPAQVTLSQNKFEGRLLCPACQQKEGGNG